jgi:hypothetical protein
MRGNGPKRWTAVLGTVLGSVLGSALAVTACAAPAHHVGAAPRPPVVPGEVHIGPDLSGVQLPNFIMPLISGGVSVPRPALTPGAVSTTSTTKVCDAPPASQVQTVPLPLENAVFAAYGYQNPANHNRYILDFLVPASLGGAMTEANIWPAAVKGTGFFEKVQLDHVLKNLVCHRFLTLRHAQHALETDWYAAWLKYVVATGHF